MTTSPRPTQPETPSNHWVCGVPTIGLEHHPTQTADHEVLMAFLELETGDTLSAIDTCSFVLSIHYTIAPLAPGKAYALTCSQHSTRRKGGRGYGSQASQFRSFFLLFRVVILSLSMFLTCTSKAFYWTKITPEFECIP